MARFGRAASGGASRLRSFLAVGAVVFLCCCFFELGAWQMGGARGDKIHLAVMKEMSRCSSSVAVEFESHDGQHGLVHLQHSDPPRDPFPTCHPHHNLPQRPRLLRCLLPAPRGYVSPFPWPASREFVPSANLPPNASLAFPTSYAHSDDDVFRFLARGPIFPNGVDAYLDELASVVPFHDGTVRTVLDTGCGVASLGAYLFDRDVLAMSFAPWSSNKVEVQFALERGVPAVVGALDVIRLPYPSLSFDMVHCSHCPVPWTLNGGMYMMEVDRVLRPGGYWALSGPPINWKMNFEKWNQSKEILGAEEGRIEKIAELLCWEKKYEKGDIAIWRKNTNDASCLRNEERSSIGACNISVVSDIWHKNITACIASYPKVNNSEEVAGGQLKKFPKRLFNIPPIISHGYIPRTTAKNYRANNKSWKNRVATYKKFNKYLGTARYRNILDMNAGFGGFAAALESPNSWVMNVVPTISKDNTLGVIYERGLIGIYHDWCEAFPTYPRTYDLIHASDLFRLYQDKCKMEDILLEMDRILRPEGAVIFYDKVDTVVKLKNLVGGMKWDTKISDSENGPQASNKILMAVKRYWVTGENGHIPS